MKIKNFLFTLLLSSVTMAGFAQTKDTVYSDNICLFEGDFHADDLEVNTQIIISDSVATFLNLKDSSKFTVNFLTILSNSKLDEGETAILWKATLNDQTIVFGILRNADKKVVSLAIVKGENALVYLILQKAEAVLNKN